jgi:hypothetical protein
MLPRLPLLKQYLNLHRLSFENWQKDKNGNTSEPRGRRGGGGGIKPLSEFNTSKTQQIRKHFQNPLTE